MGRVVKQKTLEKGLRADFMKAYDTGESPADVKPLILETQSSSNKEDYGWLGSAPNLSEWLDERQLHGLLDFEYTIPNKDYEATIAVDRNALEDDQLGAVRTRVQDLAKKAKLHPRKKFFETVAEGTTELCYDGQPFFATTHQDSADSGVQSNLLTGTGISLAQIKADFEAAECAMMEYKDDRGEPFNEGEMDLYVVCRPCLKAKFNELRTSKQIDSSDNSLNGRFKLIVSSRLPAAEDSDWYLAKRRRYS